MIAQVSGRWAPLTTGLRMVLTLQGTAIPGRQISCSFIRRLQKIKQGLVRRARLSYHIVGEDELPEIAAVEGFRRLDACLREPRRFRVGIGVERRVRDRTSTRPEPKVAHFV